MLELLSFACLILCEIIGWLFDKSLSIKRIVSLVGISLIDTDILG